MAGGDTAVKAKAALAVNGAFFCHVDHGSSRKVGANSRAAVDNRQQWQRQSGNNQLKEIVASSGVDSHGGSSKQHRLTAIGSKMPTVKAIVVTPPTALLLLSAGLVLFFGDTQMCPKTHFSVFSGLWVPR